MKRLIDPSNVFEDDFGDPLSGGFVHFYTTGTATRRNTYSNVGLTVLNPNPMPLGSDGRLLSDVYATGTFTVRSVDRNGATIRSLDNISSTYDAEEVVYTPPFSGSAASNVEAALARVVYVSDFNAALDGVTADDVPFALAVSAAANSTLIIDGPMRLDNNVTVPATVYVIAQGTITMASGKYFTAMLITHAKEKWQSGFNGDYDMRAFCMGLYTTNANGYVTTQTITANFDYALANMVGARHLHFSPGYFLFSTKPAAITSTVYLVGAGMSQTTLVRGYSEAAETDAFINFLGNGTNGSSIQDMFLGPAAAVTGGTILKFATNVDEASGYYSVSRVVISYGSNTSGFIHCLLLDGSNNDSAGQGIRDVSLSDVFLFQATVTGLSALKINNGVNTRGTNIWVGGKLWITGGGTTPTNSVDITLHVNSVGEVAIDNARFCVITGLADTVNIASTASGCSFIGQVSSVTTNYSLAGIINKIDAPRMRNRADGAVIASGATSVVITHGVKLTPIAAQITLTQTNNPTNDPGFLYVDTITSTQFTVNCKNDPGASTLIFSWDVDVTHTLLV